MIQEDNNVNLCGKIISLPSIGSTYWGMNFWCFKIGIARFSEYVDEIPIVLPFQILTGSPPKLNDTIKVKGQYRSHNEFIDGRSHLFLEVYAVDFIKIDEAEENNEIILKGIVCKKPILRITPFGKVICDFMVAVNRETGSDYIPIIAWSKYAHLASEFDVGIVVKLIGRIQSRKYIKKTLYNDCSETKIAYEISVTKFV